MKFIKRTPSDVIHTTFRQEVLEKSLDKIKVCINSPYNTWTELYILEFNLQSEYCPSKEKMLSLVF